MFNLDILGFFGFWSILGILAEQTLILSYSLATIQRAYSKGINSNKNGFITSQKKLT